MLFLVASFAVSADTNNAAYEVTKYDLHAEIDQTHSYHVTENVSVNLPDDLTGISFEIPNGNFRMFDLKVKGLEFKNSRTSSSNTISIENPEALTKGDHTYEISYTIREFKDRDDEKDMFYFDALLPSWSRPITEFSIVLDFPENFPWEDMQYYAGQYGVQNVDTKINYVADEEAKTVSLSGMRIPENFGVTVKAELPNGYWQGALDGAWATQLAMLIMTVVTFLLLIMWFIGGRDPKVKKIEQAHPIEGITPAEIGYIFSTRVRTRDIISLIVYFGTKGYLKISEYEAKKYKLIRLEAPKQEEKFVRNAYDILFEDVPVGRWVEMDELGDKMQRIKKAIEEDVAAGFSSKEMNAYTGLSRAFRTIGMALLGLSLAAACILKYSYEYMSPNFFEAAAILAVTCISLNLLCKQVDRQVYEDEKRFTLILIGLSILFVAVPVYVSVSIILLTGEVIPAIAIFVTAIIGALLIILMRARAKGNAILASRFMQLRHFIYHPTATVLAENYFQDPNYYYDIVPYALYFNGLETWAISFLTLNVPEPEWYSDDIEGNAFSNIRGQATVLDYARDIKAFARTIEGSYREMQRRHKK